MLVGALEETDHAFERHGWRRCRELICNQVVGTSPYATHKLSAACLNRTKHAPEYMREAGDSSQFFRVRYDGLRRQSWRELGVWTNLR